MVYTYFEIGRMIVEDERRGEARADYGKIVLLELSKKLTAKFGKGFFENMRKFYIVYSSSAKKIQQKPSAK